VGSCGGGRAQENGRVEESILRTPPYLFTDLEWLPGNHAASTDFESFQCHGSGTYFFWTGFVQLENQSSPQTGWVTYDDWSPVGYALPWVNAADGQIDSVERNVRNCAIVNANGMSDSSCRSMALIACQISSCPEQWEIINGMYVKVFHSLLSWNQAVDFCSARDSERGSRLMIPRSFVLSSVLSKMPFTNKAWIGVYKNSTGWMPEDVSSALDFSFF